jgi:hypothetical protein
MPAQMTRRERVERTMACEETDRVPLYDLLRNDAAFAFYAREPLPPLSADPATLRALDRISGRAVGAFLDMTRSVGFGPVEEKDVVDEFGFTVHHAPFEKTTWIAARPFRDEAGATDFLRTWIARTDAGRKTIEAHPGAHREAFHRRFLDIQARIGDTVNLLTQHGTGLDEVRHRLGVDLFAYLCADHPGLISEALEAATRRNIAECHAIADRSLSPAVLVYGDIACRQRLMHAPAWLRAEFFPRIGRLIDAWHEHGFKCLFHSDGYLMDILDDLLAAGIDGLNPIENRRRHEPGRGAPQSRPPHLPGRRDRHEPAPVPRRPGGGAGGVPPGREGRRSGLLPGVDDGKRQQLPARQPASDARGRDGRRLIRPSRYERQWGLRAQA